MSLVALACRTGAGDFNTLFWSPFARLVQLAHAAQTLEGAQMRWLKADEADVTETLTKIQALCSPTI